MDQLVPWSSQLLDEWGRKYARGKFIELDGHQTHYIEKGEGDPVILMRGFYFDTHLWDHNIDALAQKYKVYAIDLWGFGYSTRAMLDFGYPLYTHQVLEFMDALNIPQAVLIGQSMGAGTAVQLAAAHPDRVRKLVLVDPALLPNKLPLMGKIANLPGVGEFMLRSKGNFMRKLTLTTTFIHNNQHITPEYLERVTRFPKIENTSEIMLKILRKQFFHTLQDQVHQLAVLNVPALIVGGRQSKGIPIELTQEVHRILTGSQLEIFDQCGHCPNDEHPEKFNQLVLDFLA